ncbi:MAG: AMP-binding protein [Nitriliruptorales bacterium]|nr:AMP-binding protein [Nitriliruptorales bacterium]
MNSAAEPSLVALRLPAGPEWLAAADAAWEAGDAILPLPVDAPDAIVAEAVREFRPAAVVDLTGRTTFPGGIPAPAGTAVVVTTSGSTDVPKGVMLSHHALNASARASLSRLGAQPSDRWLNCLPLEHVAGLQVVIRSRLLGSIPVIHERFSVEAVAAERDVDYVSLVPTMLRRLLDRGADLRHLRCVLLGGAAPGPRLLDDAANAGVRVVTTYGMTETCGGCVYDGVPLDGVDVAVDGGRIRIAGDVLFTGYRLRDDLAAGVLENGWLQTNDLGRLVDGRLEVLGRSDDVIVTGGRNVSADAVARLLEHHPDIAEAAVTGREDREWGQRVVAFVVAVDRQPTLEQLRRFLSGHAPAYAAPRELVLVDALPRLPNGKIDRRALQRLT